MRELERGNIMVIDNPYSMLYFQLPGWRLQLFFLGINARSSVIATEFSAMEIICYLLIINFLKLVFTASPISPR